MSNYSDLLSLPNHILISITMSLAKEGFKELGQLIATSKTCMALAFDVNVLKVAALHLFEVYPELVNIGSQFRPFFLRCFQVGNITATLLEALRLVTREGKIEEAIDILSHFPERNEAMSFSLGIFQLCIGDYYDGVDELNSFLQNLPSHSLAELLSEIVFQQIRHIGPLKIRPYCLTWRFYNVPKCAAPGYSCDIDNRCPDCFIWWRSIQFYCFFGF